MSDHQFSKGVQSFHEASSAHIQAAHKPGYEDRNRFSHAAMVLFPLRLGVKLDHSLRINSIFHNIAKE